MRKLGLTLFLIFVIHQNCFHFRVKASDGFIITRGVQFYLKGYPFYANGFNAYWLMYMASDPSQRHRVSDALREASNDGLTLARTWAFSDGGDKPLQYAPGSYNEDMFKGLDFVVAKAKNYGMKVILSLVNNYESFGGKKQYVEWAKSQGQPLSSEDDFFTNSLVKTYYKNHIKTVLNRNNTLTGVVYQNDPTIMAWELMNEPRCPSDPSGSTIQSWIEEMAKYLKSLDTNHLVEAGLEGFYGISSPHGNLNLSLNVGTDFISNNRISAIDFATTHVYPDQWLSSSSDEDQRTFLGLWLDSHIQDSQIALGKPLLIAEFGKSSKDAAFTSDQRDALYSDVFSKIYSSAKRGGAAAGGLFWQLFAEGMENFGDGYEIVLSQKSSTANLIAQQAHKLGHIRKILARMTDARRPMQKGGASDPGHGKRIGN